MKLYRRQDSPDAAWYWRGMIRGKRYRWSTKLTDHGEALKAARKYRNAIVAGQHDLLRQMKGRAGCLTFGGLLEQYDAAPLGIQDDTRRKAHLGLLAVMAAAGLTKADTVDMLSRHTALRYQSLRLAEGVAPTTINSVMRAARSVFSQKALMNYEPAPDMVALADFLKVPRLREEEKLPELPTEENLRAAHKHLPDNPDMYRAFLLAFYGGLRRGEAEAARWGWIQGDVIFIGGREFVAKSKKWRTVRLAPEVLALLGVRGADDALILGPEAANVVRLLPASLRTIGFKSRTPLHSCRRMFGSLVAEASGLRAAQSALGHASYATTEKSYARQLTVPIAVPLVRATPTPAPSGATADGIPSSIATLHPPLPSAPQSSSAPTAIAPPTSPQSQPQSGAQYV